MYHIAFPKSISGYLSAALLIKPPNCLNIIMVSKSHTKELITNDSFSRRNVDFLEKVVKSTPEKMIALNAFNNYEKLVMKKGSSL